MISKLTSLQEKIDSFIGERKWHYTFAIAFSKVFGGFSAKNYFFYELYKKSRYERKKYMTDRQLRKFEKQNNSHKDAIILVDKYKFNNYFREYVKRDFLYLKDASFDDFSEFCHKHPTFMYKKNWLCEGVGIKKVHLNNDEEIKKFFDENRDYVLVEELVVQHEKMQKLHCQSVNTVRVSTLLYNNIPYVLGSGLRIGIGNSCTDNVNTGGMACAVDRKRGIVVSQGYDKNSKQYFEHPDTNICLLGFKIPNWDIVIDTVTEAAKLLPNIKFIGWDIAITDKGCTIIEGNTIQDVDLLQVKNGLWPRIREILNI